MSSSIFPNRSVDFGNLNNNGSSRKIQLLNPELSQISDGIPPSSPIRNTSHAGSSSSESSFRTGSSLMSTPSKWQPNEFTISKEIERIPSPTKKQVFVNGLWNPLPPKLVLPENISGRKSEYLQKMHKLREYKYEENMKIAEEKRKQERISNAQNSARLSALRNFEQSKDETTTTPRKSSEVQRSETISNQTNSTTTGIPETAREVVPSEALTHPSGSVNTFNQTSTSQKLSEIRNEDNRIDASTSWEMPHENSNSEMRTTSMKGNQTEREKNEKSSRQKTNVHSPLKINKTIPRVTASKIPANDNVEKVAEQSRHVPHKPVCKEVPPSSSKKSSHLMETRSPTVLPVQNGTSKSIANEQAVKRSEKNLTENDFSEDRNIGEEVNVSPVIALNAKSPSSSAISLGQPGNVSPRHNNLKPVHAIQMSGEEKREKVRKRRLSSQKSSSPNPPKRAFSERPRLLGGNSAYGDVICSQEIPRMQHGISTFTESNMTDMPDGKAPHFPQQPVARQNDDGSLELECFVDANPTPQVKWYYDNKEVENSGRFSANLANKGSDSYSAILTIKELADADAGAYRCAIVNPHGKGNANFNLKLTGFSSPTFVEKPQISSRDDGQVMVMEFRAKSILEPTFVWQKLVGGGAEEIIANSDRIKSVKKLEAGNVYYSALEIKEPTKDKDAGQFICTVKNESGKLTATFTVKFEVPEGAPSFTRKPQILQQTSAGGEPAICFDIGYSARMNPQVTWISPKSKKMKESSRIKFKTNDEGNGNFTAQLELTNYKAKDSGTYTCNIKNDAGEANVELTLNIEGPLDDYADDSEN